MKKKLLYIIPAVTLTVTAFSIGRMTVNQTEPSHWELSEENTVLLYDYAGNVYEWK